MSVLELKGSLMDMISSVQNEETLERLVNLFKKKLTHKSTKKALIVIYCHNIYADNTLHLTKLS